MLPAAETKPVKVLIALRKSGTIAAIWPTNGRPVKRAINVRRNEMSVETTPLRYGPRHVTIDCKAWLRALPRLSNEMCTPVVRAATAIGRTPPSVSAKFVVNCVVSFCKRNNDRGIVQLISGNGSN